MIKTAIKAGADVVSGLPPGYLVMMLPNMVLLGFLVWMLTYDWFGLSPTNSISVCRSCCACSMPASSMRA